MLMSVLFSTILGRITAMLTKLLRLCLLVVFVASMVLAAVHPAAAKDDVPPGFPCKTYYQIKSGDTLFKIEQAFGTPALVLMKMNSINAPELILPGQVICVKYYVSAGTFVVVGAGQTLTQIADLFDKSTAYLAAVNDVEDASSVYQGQVIFVPKIKRYFPD
jgi:LysM repeat protein